MRALNTNDAFEAARLIQDAGIRPELEAIIGRIASGQLKPDINSIGIMGVLRFIELMTSMHMQGALYEFLAGPYEMTPDDVGELTIAEQLECAKKLAQDEGLNVFFDFVSALIGLKPQT